MRISDWSSDVCSSDLTTARGAKPDRPPSSQPQCRTGCTTASRADAAIGCRARETPGRSQRTLHGSASRATEEKQKSEERRVGKECVNTCRARVEASHETKKIKQLSKVIHSIKKN